MIPLLRPNDPFPPVSKALRSPTGLLCAGADLSPQRLLDAYSKGIFPWFSEGDPILWWSPHPRMVLFPGELKVSRSLRRAVAKGVFETRYDTAFADVMRECAAPRDGRITKLKPNANYLLQHCEYGFTVNIPLEVALAPNFLLATHYNGEPLEPDHGYPLRGVIGYIPNTSYTTPYFWKGGKWLRGLECLEKDELGFWEQAGYHNEADIWKEQRFA